MTQRRLLFLVLGPIALTPILLWSGRFVGMPVAFGLVGLLAVGAGVGLMSWMQNVSRRRVELMRRLGFSLAPEAAAALSRNTALGKQVTQATWTVLSDRAFHGTSFGVPVTYFDAHKDFGGDLYNAATVVGAHLSELLRAKAPVPHPVTAETVAQRLKVIESKGSLFCFRPDHMVPDNEVAILDFLQQAMPALLAEAERQYASRSERR
jgi:hypothetical protein